MRKKVSDDINLMKEWNTKANSKNEIYPERYTCGSNKEVSWKCKFCGREWEQAIKKKAYSSGCPSCRAKERRLKLIKMKVKQGVNDLQTVKPDIAKQWKSQEYGLNPSQVTANSNVDVLWECELCGHQWIAPVYARTAGTKCPKCGMKEHNDLMLKYPQIVTEWDYDRNNIRPQDLKAYSNKKVWWVCSKCGHKWKTSVENRTRNGTGCPNCVGKEDAKLGARVGYCFKYI